MNIPPEIPPREQGWQFIETAPRDGSLFVALYRWSDRDVQRVAICSFDQSEQAFCEGSDSVFLEGLTLWTALPPAARVEVAGG